MMDRLGYSVSWKGLFYDYFLCVNLVCTYEAQDVCSAAQVEWRFSTSLDGLVNEDASQDINDLKLCLTLVEDVELTIADISKCLTVTIIVPAVGSKEQFEPRSIVARLGLESVARRGQKVNVDARKVVDEVKVVQLYALGFDADGIKPILDGCEVDRHLILSIGVGHSKVLTVLWDVDFASLVAKVVFHELVFLIETDFCQVNDGIASRFGIGDRNVDAGCCFRGVFAENDAFASALCLD